MDKKPLIVGSLCAVVLLVLGSLNNVVGYQTLKSNTMSESPLFKTRTQRIINKECNVLISNYLGKEFNSLSFPTRDNRTALIQNVIERIKTMEDITFKRFVNEVISYLNNNDKFNNIDKKQVVINLYRLRERSEKVQMFVDDSNREITIDTEFICGIYMFFLWIIMFIYMILDMIFPTVWGEYCLPFGVR